jgi:hypothetical protein
MPMADDDDLIVAQQSERRALGVEPRDGMAQLSCMTSARWSDEFTARAMSASAYQPAPLLARRTTASEHRRDLLGKQPICERDPAWAVRAHSAAEHERRDDRAIHRPN